jgi:hypothetical protein
LVELGEVFEGVVEVVCFGCGMSVGVEGLMEWEGFGGVEGLGVGVFMGWGVVVGVGMG